MVEDLYNKLNSILESVEKQFGSVDFFAAFKMDEITDKWSLLIGATWVDDEKRKDAFIAVVRALQEVFEEEERHSIARVGIFNSNDHLIQLMLKQFGSKETIIDDKKINGNIIHEGYILKSETVH